MSKIFKHSKKRNKVKPLSEYTAKDFKDRFLRKQRKALHALVKTSYADKNFRNVCFKCLRSSPTKFKNTSRYYFLKTCKVLFKTTEVDLIQESQNKIAKHKERLAAIDNRKIIESSLEKRNLALLKARESRIVKLIEKLNWQIPYQPEGDYDKGISPKIVRLSKHEFEVRQGVERLHGPGSFESMKEFLCPQMTDLGVFQTVSEDVYKLHIDLPYLDDSGLCFTEGLLLEDGTTSGLWHNSWKYKTTSPINIHIIKKRRAA